MIPYVENFLTEYEADELFESLLTLGGKREKNKRNNNSCLRRISYPGWSPELDHRPAAQYTTVPYDTAPDFIKTLADKLTAFAGKEIRYLSVVGYENEKDHMNWHQHKEDKRPIHCEDMTVWVVNLGEVRTIGIRPVGSKDKSQYEYLRPKHGSLYILPSEYNNTHEHAVLDDEFPCGLRISINCKHIPPPDTRPRCTVAGCDRPPVPEFTDELGGDSGGKCYQHGGNAIKPTGRCAWHKPKATKKRMDLANQPVEPKPPKAKKGKKAGPLTLAETKALMVKGFRLSDGGEMALSRYDLRYNIFKSYRYDRRPTDATLTEAIAALEAEGVIVKYMKLGRSKDGQIYRLAPGAPEKQPQEGDK